MVGSVSPSVVTAILVLSITTILSTCLCLLIRYLIRRCTADAALSSHTSTTSFSSTTRVSPQHLHDPSLVNTLPLFTFASIRTSSATSDCAVCLSKFEPHDELRLLPICCHAFHAHCVDAWLQSSQTKTCPLCRSIIFASEDEILTKVLAASALDDTPPSNGSFRIEIGNVSRRLSSDLGASHRSSTYSLGSFHYVIDTESEVAAAATQTRAVPQNKEGATTVEGHSGGATTSNNNLAAEVGGGGTSRSWLRDYVDRLSATLSSRTLSFRSSGRFFGGSDRRNDVAGEYEVEANRAGEEISEMFRWFSGV
uniref:RING-type domain-containing protein n=1 Tax=Kalanchoe fedtschenkoi TaxID=63787 RepID=A0A7N0TDQ8_KALFE